MQETKEVDRLEVAHTVSIDEFVAMTPEEQRAYIIHLARHEADRRGWVVPE